MIKRCQATALHTALSVSSRKKSVLLPWELVSRENTESVETSMARKIFNACEFARESKKLFSAAEENLRIKRTTEIFRRERSGNRASGDEFVVEENDFVENA